MLIRTAILFPILSIALAAPTLALAESEMHFSRGEVGYKLPTVSGKLSGSCQKRRAGQNSSRSAQ
jgi:hypothetical protein